MANTKPSTAIWTPDGVVDLAGKRRDRVELRPGLTEWLAQFADFAAHFQLGLHCAKCGADLVGKNAVTDKTFAVVCNCREFVGANRDYREPNAAEAFYESIVEYDPKKGSVQ
jgi:hypothetical protein